MKAVVALIGGFGLIGLAFGIFMLIASIYGLYLAFSASILLGIVCFFVEPSPLIIGLAMMAFHKNLAELLIQWLSK